MPNQYSHLVELLQSQANTQPEKIVYTFLTDGENETEHLTYQALDQQAKAIALQLQTITNPHDRALLVYPYNNGLDFVKAFFGCLYAQVIAVPCHPPLNRLTTTEIEERLLSAQANLVLTHSSLVSKLQSKLAKIEQSQLNWFSTDKIKLTDTSPWQLPALNSDQIAFLQYTSGSTGNPKGVMVTHDSILQNQEMLKQAFGHHSQSCGLGWLPLFHDMGLIGNVIQAIYVGASCILFSPVAFVQKPIRWLKAISKYQATTSGAPNFAYDLLCDQVKDEQLADLDLSSWEVAFSGAEPIQKQTIERFSKKFSICGFRSDVFFPCYGMAEATLFVTGANKIEPPIIKYVDKAALEENKVQISDSPQKGSFSLISCGRPWLNSRIVIVNPQSLTECPDDQIGEIWVSSSSLGKGYWQQPELTAQTFQATLKDSKENTFLKTGDLGFIYEQELFITGRLHDAMVIWGLNHYPQHLEQTVEKCHPALQANGGTAFSIPVAGQERLVIVQEIKRSYRNSLVRDEVVEAIRFALFQQHFLDVYAIALIKPFSLPKTSSGKVKRSECKSKFLNQTLDLQAQWYLSEPQLSNMTKLLQRYLNPLTYLKMYAAIARGSLRRLLYQSQDK